jgi:hypothetical protein
MEQNEDDKLRELPAADIFFEQNKWPAWLWNNLAQKLESSSTIGTKIKNKSACLNDMLI